MSNQPRQNQGHCRSPHQTSARPGQGLLSRLAWLPIPLFLAALAGLWAADLRTPYESSDLLLVLNLVFSVLVCLFIAYLVGRSFLVRSAPGLLLLGCGVVIWGAAGFVGIIAGFVAAGGRLDINVLITVHNSCVWLSGLCHLTGVGLSRRPRRALAPAGAWLTGGYALALGAVGLVFVATLAGWMPTFFVQGQGGTPLRYLVLGSALGMFALTALLLHAADRRSRSAFAYWYSLALALIAVGLFGIMIESVHGGVLSWMGRAPQFLSGVYLLAAAIASARETHAWSIPLETALQRERDLNAAILSTVGALVVVLDREGRIVRFNRACEQLTGYHFEEVKGRPFWDFLLLPEERRGVEETFVALQRGGLPNEHENYWVAKDGSRRLIHWSNTVLADSAGDVEHLIGTGIDVTARRQAEEALSQAEAELREAQRVARMGNWYWDLETDAVTVSEQTYRMLGLDPALPIPVLREQEWQLYTPESQERVRAAVQKAIRTGAGYTLDVEARRADGTPLWVTARAEAVRGADGRIAGLRGTNQDITERKQAEAELARQRALLESVIQQMPAGLSVVDATGQIVLANERGLQILRHPELPADLGARCRQLLVRAPDGRLYGPEEMPAARVLATGEAVTDEETVVTRGDGTEATLLMSVRPLREAGGAVTSAVVVYDDITERKRIAAEREAVAERYAALFGMTSDGVWIHDLGGRIREVNDAYCRLSGYTREEIVGMPISALEAVETPQQIADHIRYVIEAGGHDRFESQHRRKDGSVFDVDITAVYLDREGGRMAILTRDITARKQAEQERERLHQMVLAAERARAEVAEHLSDEIAHRVKNNLAIISGLLQMQMLGEPDPHTAEALRDAIGRIRTFVTLHQQMYDSRTEEADLLVALQRVGVMTGGLFAGRNDVEIRVCGEPFRCGARVATNLSVITNELITNALKHGNAGPDGRRTVVVSLQSADQEVMLSVWNSGAPVPADLDPAQSRTMGLRLVYDLVGQYQGRFSLRPSEGGTLAEVVVPGESVRADSLPC